MKNKFFIVAIALLGIFTAVFFYLKGQVASTTQTTSKTMTETFSAIPADNNILVKPHAPNKGAFDAKVTIVEFLDPECESCGAMSPLVKKIYEEHQTQIRLVVRYMAFHQNSKYVANILEGTRAENKYWEALELLFATQGAWANHQNPNPDLIPEILKPLNLNMKKIIADAKAGRFDKQILEDMDDGKKVGVRGTPTFFVNGNQVTELGYDSLKEAIEAELKKN